MEYNFKVGCFKKLDDAEPTRKLDCNEYSVHNDGGFHRVVVEPNDPEPKNSEQLHIRDGERRPTDPLRYERIEVIDMRSGRLVWGRDYRGGEYRDPAYDVTEMKLGAPTPANEPDATVVKPAQDASDGDTGSVTAEAPNGSD